MNIGGSKYEDEKSGKTDEYSKKKKTFKSENQKKEIQNSKRQM